MSDHPWEVKDIWKYVTLNQGCGHSLEKLNITCNTNRTSLFSYSTYMFVKNKNTGSNLFTRYIHAKEVRYKLSNFKNGSKTLYLLYCSEIGCVITRWVDIFVLSCIFRLMCLLLQILCMISMIGLMLPLFTRWAINKMLRSRASVLGTILSRCYERFVTGFVKIKPVLKQLLYK